MEKDDVVIFLWICCKKKSGFLLYMLSCKSSHDFVQALEETESHTTSIQFHNYIIHLNSVTHNYVHN